MTRIRERIVDLVTRAALIRHRRRRLDPRTGAVGASVNVNLGSGLEVAPGWINVDASLMAMVAAWPRVLQRVLFRQSGYSRLVDLDEFLRRLRTNRFVHHDLTASLPFVDESVDFVFTSHFLEHLAREQGLEVLREAHRILAPGGVIRVAVPDLERAIALYAGGEARRMLDECFYRPEKGRLAQHRYMYDWPLLAQILGEAGFSNVQRCSYREGTLPDLDLLDNRPEETLFVEGTKPNA